MNKFIVGAILPVIVASSIPVASSAQERLSGQGCYDINIPGYNVSSLLPTPMKYSNLQVFDNGNFIINAADTQDSQTFDLLSSPNASLLYYTKDSAYNLGKNVNWFSANKHGEVVWLLRAPGGDGLNQAYYSKDGKTRTEILRREYTHELNDVGQKIIPYKGIEYMVLTDGGKVIYSIHLPEDPNGDGYLEWADNPKFLQDTDQLRVFDLNTGKDQLIAQAEFKTRAYDGISAAESDLLEQEAKKLGWQWDYYDFLLYKVMQKYGPRVDFGVNGLGFGNGVSLVDTENVIRSQKAYVDGIDQGAYEFKRTVYTYHDGIGVQKHPNAQYSQIHSNSGLLYDVDCENCSSEYNSSLRYYDYGTGQSTTVMNYYNEYKDRDEHKQLTAASVHAQVNLHGGFGRGKTFVWDHKQLVGKLAKKRNHEPYVWDGTEVVNLQTQLSAPREGYDTHTMKERFISSSGRYVFFQDIHLKHLPYYQEATQAVLDAGLSIYDTQTNQLVNVIKAPDYAPGFHQALTTASEATRLRFQYQVDAFGIGQVTMDSSENIYWLQTDPSSEHAKSIVCKATKVSTKSLGELLSQQGVVEVPSQNETVREERIIGESQAIQQNVPAEDVSRVVAREVVEEQILGEVGIQGEDEIRQAIVPSEFAKKNVGKLLLQVEDRGRIWYVAPSNAYRYEVTFQNALSLFQQLAVGISSADLAKIGFGANVLSYDNDSDNDGYSDRAEAENGYNPFGVGRLEIDNALANRLRGQLLLDTQNNGRIWYVDLSGARYEVTWGNLMTLFQKLAVGITNADLDKIPEGKL